MNENVDVVVVGAGPVGLLMAIELALAGVSALVLERLGAPSMALKAGGIGPLGIETLQRRGLATPIDAAETRILDARIVTARTMAAGLDAKDPSERNGQGAPARPPRHSGHFAGLTLIRAEAQDEPDRRARIVDQQATEAMLIERARALEIEVRRDCEVSSIAQRADGVDVAWTAPSGDGVVRCRYVVGCDGGRSAVRKMAGFAFPGTDPTMTMYQANVDLDRTDLLSPGFVHTPGGMYVYGFMPRRLGLVTFSGPPEDRQAPVTREEIEAVLRGVSGMDVRVTTIENASRWTDNTRLVDTYRRGRVLLAGDAAHIHSPAGGQGMGLGLADAANLGWKLAAVVRGAKPESLLDTYTTERRPVAEAVLANTLAQAAIMRPGPQASAMRDLMAKLMQLDDVNRFLNDMMSGLGTRYDLGATRNEVGRLIGDRPVGPSSEESRIETTLYDLMQDGMGVLLDASADGSATRIAASIPRLRCVAIEAGPSMLIRPDACIAWASEDDDTAGLDAALQRWFDPSDAEGAATARAAR